MDERTSVTTEVPASSRGSAMGLACLSPLAGSFLRVATPLIAVGLGYELLRWVTPLRGTVHVAELHAAELAIFGVPTAAGVRALSDVIAAATHPVLDVVTAITYLLYLIEVLLLVAYLSFRDRGAAEQLAYGFLAINLLGWAVWLGWPAAPPWYVDQYGLGSARLDVASSAAGALRFDAFINVPIFERYYEKSTNVFGAMPSLHVGYAVLSALAARHAGSGLRALAILFAVSMAYAAVYLRHHYLLDVLAGAGLAVVAHLLVRAGRSLGARQPPPGTVERRPV